MRQKLQWTPSHSLYIPCFYPWPWACFPCHFSLEPLLSTPSPLPTWMSLLNSLLLQVQVWLSLMQSPCPVPDSFPALLSEHRLAVLLAFEVTPASFSPVLCLQQAKHSPKPFTTSIPTERGEPEAPFRDCCHSSNCLLLWGLCNPISEKEIPSIT